MGFKLLGCVIKEYNETISTATDVNRSDSVNEQRLVSARMRDKGGRRRILTCTLWGPLLELYVMQNLPEAEV